MYVAVFAEVPYFETCQFPARLPVGHELTAGNMDGWLALPSDAIANSSTVARPMFKRWKCHS